MNFKQLNYNYNRNQQYRGEVCTEVLQEYHKDLVMVHQMKSGDNSISCHY